MNIILLFNLIASSLFIIETDRIDSPMALWQKTYALLLLFCCCSAFQYINSLKSMQTCFISINLIPFSSRNLSVGSDFKITLEMDDPSDPSKYSSFRIPDYFNYTLNNDIVLGNSTSWRLFNMYQRQVNYRLTIKIINDDLQYLQAEIDQLYLRRAYLRIQNRTNNFFVSIVNDALTSGLILPFNMINPKESLILSDEQNSKKLAYIDYQLPPFMPTFWGQNQISSTILPWIPYLSRCSNYDERIYINELINSQACRSQVSQNNLKIQNGIPFFDNSQKQSKCSLKMDCILQEWNSTSQQTPWWQSTNNVLFYIYPTLLTGDQYLELKDDQERVSQLINEFKNELVPVYFKPDSVSTRRTPQSIQFYLNYYVKNNKLTVGSAQIKTISSDQTNPFAILTIVLEPITLINGFNNYYLEYWMYFIIFLTISVIYSFLMIVCFKIFIKQTLTAKIKKCTELMITPLLRGVGLSTLVTFTFISICFLIAKLTSFSFIFTTFDGNYSSQTVLKAVYNGRTGLCLVFAGNCMLYNFIQQLYKVPTETEVKILATEKRKKSIVKGTGRQLKVQEDSEIEETIDHMIRVMKSKKHYTFICLYVLNLAVIYQIQLLINNSDITGMFPFLIPLITTFLKMIFKYWLVKDLLITSIIQGSQSILLGFVLIKRQSVGLLMMWYVIYSVYSALILSLSKLIQLKIKHFLSLSAEIPLKERFKQLMKYSFQDENKNGDSYNDFLIQFLEPLSVVFLRALFLFLVYLTQDQSMINSNGMIQQKFVVIQLFFMIILIPVGLLNQILSIIGIHKVNFLQMLEYGLYRFKTRTIRWGHENFEETWSQQYYKNVHNLGYSSQMYFFISSIICSLMAIWWGVNIIMRNKYHAFNDPAFTIIFLFVVIFYKLSSFVCSIISTKIKLYHVKTQKTNIALQVINLYLKKKDLLQYSNLSVVKQYFIKKNSQWIASNFFKIFSKTDFLKNNGFLLNRYRHYLNLQRAKSMEAKKKEIQMQNLPFDTKQKVVYINKDVLQKVVKPMVSRWLSLAKQHLFLQRVINQSKIRQNKQLQHCQFCKINLYISITEKYPIYTIANKFRIQNAGKTFHPQKFIQFYGRTQQFKTTCLQCRQRVKNQKNSTNLNKVKKMAKSLTLKWILMARSRLLHKSMSKSKKADYSKNNGLVPKSENNLMQSMKSLKSIKTIRQFFQNR